MGPCHASLSLPMLVCCRPSVLVGEPGAVGSCIEQVREAGAEAVQAGDGGRKPPPGSCCCRCGA